MAELDEDEVLRLAEILVQAERDGVVPGSRTYARRILAAGYGRGDGVAALDLPAQLRALAADCRAKAAPLAGQHYPAPEGIRLRAMAEAYDRAAEMAEQTPGGESRG